MRSTAPTGLATGQPNPNNEEVIADANLSITRATHDVSAVTGGL